MLDECGFIHIVMYVCILCGFQANAYSMLGVLCVKNGKLSMLFTSFGEHSATYSNSLIITGSIALNVSKVNRCVLSYLSNTSFKEDIIEKQNGIPVLYASHRGFVGLSLFTYKTNLKHAISLKLGPTLTSARIYTVIDNYPAISSTQENIANPNYGTALKDNPYIDVPFFTYSAEYVNMIGVYLEFTHMNTHLNCTVSSRICPAVVDMVYKVLHVIGDKEASSVQANFIFDIVKISFLGLDVFGDISLAYKFKYNGILLTLGCLVGSGFYARNIVEIAAPSSVGVYSLWLKRQTGLFAFKDIEMRMTCGFLFGASAV